MTTFAADWSVDSSSVEETEALGRKLGLVAEPGLVVALVGPLGAGKTQFVRGVAEGLGVPDPRVVSSPTFVLIQEYAARLPIYHFDTYRLTRPDQFSALGPEEYFEGDGICLVEWADRVEQHLPADRLDIQFAITDENGRRLVFQARGPLAQRVLRRIQSLAPPGRGTAGTPAKLL